MAVLPYPCGEPSITAIFAPMMTSDSMSLRLDSLRHVTVLPRESR
jgi:hypothetical protein